MVAKGGITKGKSHAEGGIPMTVKSTGQKVELEGGEGVINKRSMSDTTLHEFEGEKLTKCEIASKINSDKNFGVKINCDDVVGNKYKHEDGGRITMLEKMGKPSGKTNKKRKLSKSWYVLLQSAISGKYYLYKGFNTLEQAESYVKFQVNFYYALRSSYQILPKDKAQYFTFFPKRKEEGGFINKNKFSKGGDISKYKRKNINKIILKPDLPVIEKNKKRGLKKHHDNCCCNTCFNDGGKINNKVLIQILETDNYNLFDGENFKGKTYLFKDKILELEFVKYNKKNNLVYFKMNNYDLPIYRNQFKILHNKYNEGGFVNKSKLSFEDLGIISFINNNNFNLTIDQKLHIQKFKGNNVANYLNQNISRKIWGMFYNNKPNNMLLENVYLINAGIGKLISYSSQDLNIFIGMDNFNFKDSKNLDTEIKICESINENLFNWNQSTFENGLRCQSALIFEPEINPSKNFIFEPMLWTKKIQYAMSVAEFSKPELIQYYFNKEELDNSKYKYKQFIINRGIKELKNTTVITIAEK